MNKVDELLFKLRLYTKEFNVSINNLSKDSTNEDLIEEVDMLYNFIGDVLDEFDDCNYDDNKILKVIVPLFGVDEDEW